MLRKCYGKELDGEKTIDRMVEIRTVLEKVRPIDQKLRYQVDKLVNIAEKGKLEKNDPLRYKPNPSGLMSKLEGDDGNSGEEGEEAKGEKGAKFKPTKNVPMFFDTGVTQDKVAVEGEIKKKHQISRSIMDSIKEQYTDMPEELSHKADIVRKQFIQEDTEKIRAEEENYTRFPETKTEKAKKRKNTSSTMRTIGDDVVSFGRNFYDDLNLGEPLNKKKRKGGKVGSSKSQTKSAKKFRKRM